MKKIIKYILIFLFTINGAYLVLTTTQFSFDWWLGFLNVAGWGGYLVNKLLEYLSD